MCAMLGSGGQKILKLSMLSNQTHLTTRLKNEKCFSNEKHLIETMKITLSKPLDLSQRM